jgi:hypothetical protein
MATKQIDSKVKNANDRLAKTAKALHTKALAANSGKKITHSYRLFSLLKKQKGTATTDQLAAATGLPPSYVAWYMAELKRVYGVKLQHKRGDKMWRATNTSAVSVPPGGIAGRRRGERAVAALNSSRPIASGGKTVEDVATVVANLKSDLDILVSVLNRAKIPENRPKA